MCPYSSSSSSTSSHLYSPEVTRISVEKATSTSAAVTLPATVARTQPVRGSPVGSDRMLFGTDDPAFDPVHPKEEWLDNVRALADREVEPTFTVDEINRLLGQNALDLLT